MFQAPCSLSFRSTLPTWHTVPFRMAIHTVLIPPTAASTQKAPTMCQRIHIHYLRPFHSNQGGRNPHYPCFKMRKLRHTDGPSNLPRATEPRSGRCGIEGGPSRFNAFPFYPSKGPWMSPFPDLVLLSPPAEGGLLPRIQALCRCRVGDVT